MRFRRKAKRRRCWRSVRSRRHHCSLAITRSYYGASRFDVTATSPMCGYPISLAISLGHPCKVGHPSIRRFRGGFGAISGHPVNLKTPTPARFSTDIWTPTWLILLEHPLIWTPPALIWGADWDTHRWPISGHPLDRGRQVHSDTRFGTPTEVVDPRR